MTIWDERDGWVGYDPDFNDQPRDSGEPPEPDDEDFEIAFDDPADDYARAVFDPAQFEVYA